MTAHIGDHVHPVGSQADWIVDHVAPQGSGSSWLSVHDEQGHVVYVPADEVELTVVEALR